MTCLIWSCVHPDSLSFEYSSVVQWDKMDQLDEDQGNIWFIREKLQGFLSIKHILLNSFRVFVATEDTFHLNSVLLFSSSLIAHYFMYDVFFSLSFRFDVGTLTTNFIYRLEREDSRSGNESSRLECRNTTN